jgi:hypothetical protein
MNAVMEGGYRIARNGFISAVYPSGSPVSRNYLDRVNTYQVPYAWEIPPGDLTETDYRQKIRDDIVDWKCSAQWISMHAVHTLADWDSAHVDWALDEIVADSGIWFASYGEIADYVRQYHVTVENPIDKWNDSLTASAPLAGLPENSWIYVVAVAFDQDDAESVPSNEVAFYTGEITGLEVAELHRPVHTYLGAIRPDPVRAGATVSFSIPEAGTVRLSVYDVRGRLVRTLLDRELAAGDHEIPWSAGTGARSRLAPGVYFCRLEAGAISETSRLVVVR